MEAPNNTIFIKNLPYGITEREIKSKFDKYGEIKSINPKNGFCFIEYTNEASSKEAIREMNERTFEGRAILVKYCQDKKDRTYERKGPQQDDVCKNCQEKGHWAYQCPNEKRVL